MATKTDDALVKAEKKAATARASKKAAEQDVKDVKKKARDEKKEEKEGNKHIFVRLTTELIGTGMNVAGTYTGARFLGPGRRVIKKVPFTWGALGMSVGTVGKMATVAIEDTWAEPVVAAVAEGIKGLFNVDVVSKGLEMRAEAAAAKGKGKGK